MGVSNKQACIRFSIMIDRSCQYWTASAYCDLLV